MSKLEALIERLCPNGVEYKTLGEVATSRRGVRVVKKELENGGEYPVYQNSLKPLGYFDKYNCPEETAFV
ncbi:MAG: restriction endonuclease subunit S, partial [Acetobacter sp.]|nr:restriction endonuclease subunit S [Acetobacter sp.]